MNPKFILKEDWLISIPGLPGVAKKIKLYDKGEIFEANESGQYIIKTSSGDLISTSDNMMTAKNEAGELLFDIVKEESDQVIEIIVEEIPEDDDELVKRWRIQLDVNTTRKKLKDIEKFINENIKKLL